MDRGFLCRVNPAEQSIDSARSTLWNVAADNLFDLD